MDALTGSEVQLETFQVAVHEDTEKAEIKERIIKRINEIYEGESAHKILRISYQRGAKVIASNAGFENLLFTEIDEYVEGVMAREYLPLVFIFQCFVSFTAPRAV